MEKHDLNWPYNDFATGYDRINIKHGEFSGDDWYAIGGPKHPLFRYLIDRINYRTLMHYEIYVIGGALEPWLSWDVDIVIKGPYDPNLISKTMNAIVFSGFEVGLYADVSWSKEIRPVESLRVDWQNGTYKPMEFFRLSNRFEKDGQVFVYNEFEEVDGLYKQTWVKPPDKILLDEREGHIYQPPMRVK